MPGTPGNPIITEEWQIALVSAVIVTVVWILTRIARRVADKYRDRDRD